MILFEKIRWKNFLSTGNQFTEINFQQDNTNLIIGTNGAGKSTVLDALTFSLFNKPFRKIGKPQLVNSVNEKDCLVEIEFSIGVTDWKVVRGIKPNIFKIYRNEKVLDQFSSAVDQQKLRNAALTQGNLSTSLRFDFGSATCLGHFRLCLCPNDGGCKVNYFLRH